MFQLRKDPTLRGIDKVLAKTKYVLKRLDNDYRLKKNKSMDGKKKKGHLKNDGSAKIKNVCAVKENKFVCLVKGCHASFPYESSRTNHISSSHNNPPILKKYIKKRENPDGAVAWDCKLCDNSYGSRIGALMHIGRGHSYISDMGEVYVNVKDEDPHSFLEQGMIEGENVLKNFDGDLFEPKHVDSIEGCIHFSPIKTLLFLQRFILDNEQVDGIDFDDVEDLLKSDINEEKGNEHGDIDGGNVGAGIDIRDVDEAVNVGKTVAVIDSGIIDPKDKNQDQGLYI